MDVKKAAWAIGAVMLTACTIDPSLLSQYGIKLAPTPTPSDSPVATTSSAAVSGPMMAARPSGTLSQVDTGLAGGVGASQSPSPSPSPTPWITPNCANCVPLYPPTITSFSPLSAHVGDKVTVYGTNLQGLITVGPPALPQWRGNLNTTVGIIANIDSSTTSAINAYPSQIIITIPAGASSGSISIQSIAGIATCSGFVLLPCTATISS